MIPTLTRWLRVEGIRRGGLRRIHFLGISKLRYAPVRLRVNHPKMVHRPGEESIIIRGRKMEADHLLGKR